MAIIRAMHTMEQVSGLPEDRIANNFHFSTGDVLSPTLDAVEAAVQSFYNGGGRPAQYLGPFVQTTGARVLLYNMDDPPPRVPLRETTYAMTGPFGATAVPHEVAITCSFRGEYVSGENKARKRGRIFFGPIAESAIDKSTPAPRVTAAARASLSQAMLDLLVASDAAALWSWVVYSAGARDNSNTAIPYEDRPLLPPSFTLVTEGWVDDALDTQRRRGKAPTVRTPF